MKNQKHIEQCEKIIPEKKRKYKAYSEKLKDPRWQKKRLQIMERDEFTCQGCGDKTSTLNVHHTAYIKNKEVWNYDDIMLVTLCETCHQINHELFDEEFSSLKKYLQHHGITFHDLYFFERFTVMLTKELVAIRKKRLSEIEKEKVDKVIKMFHP